VNHFLLTHHLGGSGADRPGLCSPVAAKAWPRTSKSSVSP
jgi:hypothetical protein